MEEYVIRQATVDDSPAILDIYAYYIENTAISFETETPTLAAFSKRVADIAKEYPCFVCTINGKIAGYTYAARHRERAAYRYNVDTSIYLRNGMHGHKIGTALYTALLDELARRHYHNAYAAITLPNEKSIALHHKFGFSDIGIHHKTGYKFNMWHDVLWPEKALSDHSTMPQS